MKCAKKKNNLLKEFYALHPGSYDLLATEEKISPVLGRHFTSWDNYHFISALMKEDDFESHIHQGTIETTLDLDLQKEVAGILKNQIHELRHLRVSHGAVVVLENNSGSILAYVGTHEMEDGAGAHFDALRVKRQPGSALKPLTYALGLQKGWTLSHVLPDSVAIWLDDHTPPHCRTICQTCLFYYIKVPLRIILLSACNLFCHALLIFSFALFRYTC